MGEKGHHGEHHDADPRHCSADEVPAQDHIDELPIWADGSKLPSAPMTGMQWLIWSLAAAGKFFEGYVVFMTGVALPLFSREFQIDLPSSMASSARRVCLAY